MRYRITLTKGMAGKMCPEDAPDPDFASAAFGRCWWHWRPHFNWNGGWFSRRECVDVSTSWLCFHIGLVFWHNG